MHPSICYSAYTGPGHHASTLSNAVKMSFSPATTSSLVSLRGKEFQTNSDTLFLQHVPGPPTSWMYLEYLHRWVPEGYRSWLHTKTTLSPFNPKKQQFNSKLLLGIQASHPVPKEEPRHCATKNSFWLLVSAISTLKCMWKPERHQVTAKK